MKNEWTKSELGYSSVVEMETLGLRTNNSRICSWIVGHSGGKPMVHLLPPPPHDFKGSNLSSVERGNASGERKKSGAISHDLDATEFMCGNLYLANKLFLLTCNF